MKFVLTQTESAYHYYINKKGEDPKDYQYLHNVDQIRGHREVIIILFDKFLEKREILDYLVHYRWDREVSYELSDIR